MRNRMTAAAVLGAAWAVGLGGAAGVARAGLDIAVSMSPDPAVPGELLDIEIVVTNDGPFDATDVTVQFEWPTGLASMFDSEFEGECVSSTCDVGEIATFQLPTISAGGGRVFQVPAYVGSTVMPGTTITVEASAIDNGSIMATGSGSLVVESGRDLGLTMQQDRDPIIPGETATYTLTFGVLESSAGSPAGTITMPIPAGASFVSATGGGAESGGNVVWDAGNVPPGDSGDVSVTLAYASGVTPGTQQTLQATYTDAAANSVRAMTITRVQDAQPLELVMTAAADPIRPEEVIDFEILVTNTGSFTRTGVVIELEYPEGLSAIFDSFFEGDCTSSTCDPQETLTIAVGDLEPGSFYTESIPLRVGSDVPDGSVVAIEGRVRSEQGDQRLTGTALAVDAGRTLELAVTESRDQPAAGDTLSYTLAFGVLSSGAGAPGAMLTAELPAGVTFLSASHDVSFSGDTVTWDLGNVGPGDSGERTLEVAVNAGMQPGAPLPMQARLTQSTSRFERAAYSTAAVVSATQPLVLDITASPDPVEPGEVMLVELTVTNTGASARTGVGVQLEYPGELSGMFDSLIEGDCDSSTCDPRERVFFTVGDLAAGESASYDLPLRVGTAELEGAVFALEADARDASGGFREAGTTVAVQNARPLNIDLSADQDPALPGDEIAYTVTFGTPDAGSGISNAMLQVETDLEFVSAGGQASHSGGIITWPIGAINPGAGGERTVVLRMPGDALPGQQWRVDAVIEDISGDRSAVRAERTSRAAADLPLLLDVDLAPEPVEQGVAFGVTVMLTNNTASALDAVDVRVRIPGGQASFFDSQADGGCESSTCDPRERLFILSGPIAPGASATYTLGEVMADASDGEILSYSARAFGPNGVPIIARDAALIGDLAPPPCPADLAAPFGVLNFADVQSFLGLFNARLPGADLAAPAGVFNFADVQVFIGLFTTNCE